MTHYMNISIRSLPDISPYHILEKIFEKIHLALAASGCVDIGLSFPKVDERRRSLGDCLRLHGPEQSLRLLAEKANLATMRNYTHIGAILPIPDQVEFRNVSRVQVKSNVDRLRRRSAKRHNLSLEEATAKIPESVAKVSHLPYIRVWSQSSGQNFHLFINHGTKRQTPVHGKFSAYGLSAMATIPWF